ncbi:MAG: AAA family ATPase [Fusobacteriaceae bacterium]|nr:AAA family ATPase [Fusobacteriaceae bacterium]MBN2838908.1 AAA family ATPase [Fusobacteriaceae bacterium]
MFLKEVNLWNFRKFGNVNISDKEPALNVELKDGLNVLIGENDSGKTAIIDAIRIVLGTQSNEYYFLDEKDFYKDTSELKIECVFYFRNEESVKPAKFLEWITFDDNKKPILKIRLIAKKDGSRIKKYITAGEPDLDNSFDAMEELRITYLKPLRDADRELIAGRTSRVLQILRGHKIFNKKNDKDHLLVDIIKKANEEVDKYFSIEKNEEEQYINEGGNITGTIENHLKGFMGYEKGNYNTNINISEAKLISILGNLNLKISENKVGLGSLNQLYMALELLLFEKEAKESDTLNLCLIEEVEAHLHPQAQLRIIKHLQKQFINKENNKQKGQLILTTHSITLGSSIKLENLIICKNGKAYPMGHEYTLLEKDDYQFLEMFLDATKANLFFAKGVILVEGDAENLLIPTIAEIIGKPLHENSVSIVNLGNIAFNRYSKIFLRRKENEDFGVPIAIITDLDVNKYKENFELIFCKEEEVNIINEEYENKWKLERIKNTYFSNIDEIKEIVREDSGKRLNGIGKRLEEEFKKETVDIEEYRNNKRSNKTKLYKNGNIRPYINKDWTLEYDIAMSGLKFYLYQAINIVKGESDYQYETGESELSAIVNNEEIAKKIFVDNFYSDVKNNKKKSLSKAEVALNLANLLKDTSKKEEIKEILQKDEYLRYLVDAIIYATSECGIQ